jgi:hypothetical protein
VKRVAGLRVGLAPWALLALGACDRSAPPAVLPIEVLGCAAVRPGPVCLLPSDATLTLVPAPGDPRPEFTPPAVAEPAKPGTASRFRVVVPPGTARVDARRGAAVFSIAVAPAGETPTPAEPRHKAGQRTRRAGRPDAALAELEAATALAEAAGEVTSCSRATSSASRSWR